MFWLRANKNKILFTLLFFLVTIPVLCPLFKSGFPLTDDGNWMIIRLSAFYESLRSGQFPVRFLLRLNNGYGYPVADFLYPLYLYIGSFIHIFGISFINAVKIILGLSFLLSLTFSFLWLRNSFKNIASFIGALVFTFFPYHIFDVYKRGSVGEALSISIIPFILWQLERKNLFFTSIGICLLVLSHNSLALLYIPLIVVFGLLSAKRDLKFLFVSLILGILSAAFFWMPALNDSKFTVFGLTKISDFYSYLTVNNLNLLGIIFLLVSLLSVPCIFNKKRKNIFFVFSWVFSLLIVIALLPSSMFIWQIIPFKQLIQFPFRLISLVLIFSAYQSAYIIEQLSKNKRILFSFGFVVFISISALPFLNNIKFQDYPDSFYSTNLSTTTVKNEYMPRWVEEIPLEYPKQRLTLNTGDIVSFASNSQKKIEFKASLKTDGKAILNIIYFPGWEAVVNGKTSSIEYDNKNGFITINLIKGINSVKVEFRETPERYFADGLSIFGIILTTILYLLIKLKKINL